MIIVKWLQTNSDGKQRISKNLPDLLNQFNQLYLYPQ